MKLNKVLLTIISAYIATISLIYFILFFKATFSYYRNPPQILMIEMFLFLLIASFMFAFAGIYYTKTDYQKYSYVFASIGLILLGGAFILYPQALPELPPRYGSIFNRISSVVEIISAILFAGVLILYMTPKLKISTKKPVKKPRKAADVEIVELPVEPKTTNPAPKIKKGTETKPLKMPKSSLLRSFSSYIDSKMKQLSEKADEAARGRKFKRFEQNLKIALLDRFSMSQLEGICRARGISLQVEGKRGMRRARSKEELIPKLMFLSFDELVRIAKRHGIRYDDLLREREEARKILLEKKQDTEIEQEISSERSVLDDVLNIIQAEFKPETIRDEEDLEKQLTIFLKLKLGEERVTRQGYRGGKRVDILIDGRYGLELKLADSNQSLAALPTQLKLYSKRLEDVAAVIAIPKNLEVDEEILDILDEEGFKYVVINAEVKRG
ncbi:hypothetical protein [Geoglobus ahangari]